ncbi:MAG: exopolysaccharide biosynthesis polyprenyl glycosylphosphotransferase [Clostridiaceae bacterium]|nr:exopolysaccharide biosynthesis polyprenyl glycosylphosphotransferase [Clostridiaceae bacterium]
MDNMYGVVEGLFTFVNLTLLTLAYGFAWFSEKLSTPFPFGGNFTVLGVYAILLYTFTSLYGGYQIGQLKRLDVINSQIISILFVNAITYLQISLMERSLVLSKALPIVVLTLVDIVIIIIWAYIADAVYKKMYPPRDIALIYDDAFILNEIEEKLNLRKDKFNLKVAISSNEDFEAVKKAIEECGMVALVSEKEPLRENILKYCFENDISVYISPKLSDLMIRGASRLELFDSPIYYCSNKGLTLGQRIIKRLMDIVLSLLLIILFSPVMIVIAIAIKMHDKGPVLFKQKRYTKDGKVFNILKFRSMIVDAEKDGEVIPAEDNDPRITPVGKVIRKIRMDELPQLFNILKGDMSVVGPRPERVEHVDMYSEQIPEFRYRLKVKGGLTGYAQVLGKYNTSPYDKLRLDLIYIENYSLLLDLKLMLTTIKILFKPESTEGFNKGDEKR